MLVVSSQYSVPLDSRRMQASLILLSLSSVWAGPGDTVQQLQVALSNVPYGDQVTGGQVTTQMGTPPAWLEGSLARHACGALGSNSYSY